MDWRRTRNGHSEFLEARRYQASISVPASVIGPSSGRVPPAPSVAAVASYISRALGEPL